jgi:hypothetical protein
MTPFLPVNPAGSLAILRGISPKRDRDVLSLRGKSGDNSVIYHRHPGEAAIPHVNIIG